MMDDRWQFSSANDFVDVVVPGVHIVSTSLSSEYEISAGASISGAHVFEVPALLWSCKSDATVNEIRDAILNTTLDLGQSSTLTGRDPLFGHGLIQTMDSISYLNGQEQDGVTASASPFISSSLTPTQVPLSAPPPRRRINQ